MKQLFIFQAGSVETSHTNDHAIVEIHHWKLFVDGAAKNNPGPAGAGFCMLKDDEIILQDGYFLGIKTNNQAEYLALLLGIFFLEPRYNNGDRVDIIADSELLVRQINGIYKVKNPQLALLHACAYQDVHRLKAKVSHTLRHANKNADKMANLGIETKIMPPQEFLTKLSRYEIYL